MLTILIMGLPDSGKSTLAATLTAKLNDFCKAKWLNADAVRAEYNDYDFSEEGRKRQAFRMKGLAHKAATDGFEVCILDFVCPTPEFREIVDPQITIFMNTVKTSVHADTNAVFVPPDSDESRYGNSVIIPVTTFSEVPGVMDKVTEYVAKRLHKTELNFVAHKDSHLRSVLKGTTYRLLGSLATFAISFGFTDLAVASWITGIEVVSKIALYYIHERVWMKI